MTKESNEFLTELYLKNSRIPKRYLQNISLVPATNNDLTSFKRLKAVETNIVRFVKMHQNLLIASNVFGNGKTTWATKILKSYIYNYACKYAFQNNTPVLYINIPEFLMKKKLSISDVSISEEIRDIEKCIYTAKIVVFDDIATKLATDYDRDLLYTYINYRTDNLLTSIYTTNISSNRLKEQLDERIADRVIGYSVCIEFDGPGRRGVR